MPTLFYPFKADSTSPIPYMHKELAVNLSRYQVTIFTIRSGKEINQDNIAGVLLPSSKLGRSLTYAWTSLRKFDLLHTGGRAPRQYPISRLTTLRNWGLKHVHTLRVDVEPESDVGPFKHKKRLVKMADEVTAVSEHTARTAEEHFGVSPRVIYEGVNPNIFHPEYDRPDLFEDLDIEPPILLFVGSFQKRKNPVDVVRVAENIPDATFLMVGSGKQYDEVNRMAGDIGNLILAGQLAKEELPPIYAHSSAFLFPSEREGCPNVVLEAMAAGLPIIGYKATSMPEIVEHGRTGYLAEPNNTEELSEFVRHTIMDTGRNKIGESARRYVVENHSFEVLAEQYEALYDELL